MTTKLLESVPYSDWKKIIYKATKKFLLTRPGEDILLSKEDIEQEAWFALLRACNNFDPKNGAKFTTYAWCYIYLMVSKYVNKCKANKIKRDIFLNSVFNKPICVDNDQLDKEDFIKHIATSINSDDAEMLEMYFVLDMPLREIADKTNLSIQGVSNRINKSLKFLREKYESY